MCGICGVVDLSFQGRSEEQPVHRMLDTLQHRGPDSSRCFTDGNLSLGFARLSIIDLAGGMQPLFNEDESVIMVCNGEIFNYIELRQELEAKGHRFRTGTDVETIIHLYEEVGEQLLDRLNGQFAFLLFDYKERKLLCARDPFGIVPFFYTIQDDFLIFGSEIKAILQHPLIKSRIDLVGLDQLLTFPGLAGERTMFEGIVSLEAGHYVRVWEGRMVIREYWDLVYPEIGDQPQPDLGETYYRDSLSEMFERSVRLRLRADVPVGLYVSGGLDSSLIAATARRLRPGADLRSFSIDFDDETFSEARYQQLAARHLDLTHRSLMFHNRLTADMLPAAVYHSETPLKETYNCASLLLSKHVRDHQLKVVLSGEGADEWFAGYIGYRFDQMRMAGMYADDADESERRLRRELWGNESFYYERNYTAYEKVKRQLYSAGINERFEQMNCLSHPVIDKSKLRNRDILHQRSYIDFKLRMVNHLVADHGDRMALAHSVEARYPFLDRDLAEFMTTIPAQYMLHDLEEKYLLKRMAEGLLPSGIIEREKFSFVAPGSPELLRMETEYIGDMLSSDRIRREGYFNPEQVEALKNQYMAKDFELHVPFDADMLIIVLTFGLFKEQFRLPDLS